MSIRTSVILEDSIWEQLQAIPESERNRLVNEAVGNALMLYRRREAMKEMDSLRSKLPKSKINVIREVRRDRSRTH